MDWKKYNLERDELASLREASSKSATIVDYWNELVDKGETHMFSYRDYNERGFNTLNTPSTTFTTMSSHLKAQGLIRNGESKAVYPSRGQMMVPPSSPSTPSEPPDPSTFGSSLQKLYQLSQDFQEEEETIEDKVNGKYGKIAMKVRQLVNGRTAKEHLLIYGDAGVGKSFVVKSELARLGMKAGVDFVYKQGSIGASPTDVARFLYIHRGTPENPELIALDDADSFLVSGNQEVDNMLKGTLDGDGGTVSVKGTVVKKLTKEMKEVGLVGEDERLSPVKESQLLKAWEKRVVLREMISQMANLSGRKRLTEADDTYDDEEEDDEYLNGLSDDGGDTFPSRFTFYSKLIMISNLRMDQLNPAVTSRCELVELNLTTEEFLIKLKEVLPVLTTDRNRIPVDDWNWAKQCAMTALEAVLEASNRGMPLFGKRIRLLRKLEFRVMITLASSWIDITDIIKDSNPSGMPDDNHIKEQREWLEKRAMGKFVLHYLIPALQTET